MTGRDDLAPRAVYRISEQLRWIEVNGHLVIAAPHTNSDPLGEQLQALDAGRNRFFVEYINDQRAAYETTFGDLDWYAYRSTLVSGQDRQRMLGGIFDRDWLRLALTWLRRYSAGEDPVRMWVSQSPNHGKGDHVLVVRHARWTLCLMCCHWRTSHGDDPLPWGGERDDEGG